MTDFNYKRYLRTPKSTALSRSIIAGAFGSKEYRENGGKTKVKFQYGADIYPLYRRLKQIGNVDILQLQYGHLTYILSADTDTGEFVHSVFSHRSTKDYRAVIQEKDAEHFNLADTALALIAEVYEPTKQRIKHLKYEYMCRNCLASGSLSADGYELHMKKNPTHNVYRKISYTVK